MAKNVMVDLETMGNGNNAAITAIGAVAFTDEGEMLGTFYMPVSLESSVMEGGVIDASTVIWWMKQSDEARAEFTTKTTVGIIDALLAFEEYWEDIAGDDGIIWGNGATFDNVILASAYSRIGMKAPWTYRNSLCYRTLKNIHSDVLPDENVGVHHNALHDAEYQALHLIKILKHIKESKS